MLNSVTPCFFAYNQCYFNSLKYIDNFFKTMFYFLFIFEDKTAYIAKHAKRLLEKFKRWQKPKGQVY